MYIYLRFYMCIYRQHTCALTQVLCKPNLRELARKSNATLYLRHDLLLLAGAGNKEGSSVSSSSNLSSQASTYSKTGSHQDSKRNSKRGSKAGSVASNAESKGSGGSILASLLNSGISYMCYDSFVCETFSFVLEPWLIRTRANSR